MFPLLIFAVVQLTAEKESVKMERRENDGYGYLACRINRILWLDEDGVREGRDLGNVWL